MLTISTSYPDMKPVTSLCFPFSGWVLLPIQTQQLSACVHMQCMRSSPSQQSRHSRHGNVRRPRPIPIPVPVPPRPPLNAFPTHRAYHSTAHPPPPGPLTPAEVEILTAAYKHIPTHGFTAEALVLGARDVGYLDISATVLSDGVFQLIRWHLVAMRQALAAIAETLSSDDGNQAAVTVGKKVQALLWERLKSNAFVIYHWQEAMAIMAQPSYVGTSLKELSLLADEIWHLAGDTSVDFSWYTKRGFLAAIYTSTELFMTTDRSLEFRDTQAFLQRRISQANELGSAAFNVGEWLSFAGNATINVLGSKGSRM